MIVEPDADLELATSKVATHAFSYAGQTCVSVQRVYVQRDVIDAFLGLLGPKVQALRIGDPADETTDVGPVIDTPNRATVTDACPQRDSNPCRRLERAVS